MVGLVDAPPSPGYEAVLVLLRRSIAASVIRTRRLAAGLLGAVGSIHVAALEERAPWRPSPIDLAMRRCEDEDVVVSGPVILGEVGRRPMPFCGSQGGAAVRQDIGAAAAERISNRRGWQVTS